MERQGKTDRQTDRHPEKDETIGLPDEQSFKNICNYLNLPFLFYLSAK